MIKLANGREVTLDEFLTWSSKKQHASLTPRHRCDKRSDETRAKMSAAHKGSKKPWVDNSHHKGFKHSDETRAKMSYNAANKSD